ncbi:GPN-loop GTPase 2 [Phlyctochytrium planicorne]|nr:GPN-loop GTPase 2 [Phlyctochytrium planicorne]
MELSCSPNRNSDRYFIIDFPGQVELYTHHEPVKQIISRLQKTGLQYIAALVLSLKVMLHIELPHVNALSKIDLIQSYGKLAFDLEFYTEVQNLDYLLDALKNDKHGAKLEGLSRALCSLVEEFGLLSFRPLCINDKASVFRVCQDVERANGFAFLQMATSDDGLFNAIAPADQTSTQFEIQTNSKLKTFFEVISRTYGQGKAVVNLQPQNTESNCKTKTHTRAK